MGSNKWSIFWIFCLTWGCRTASQAERPSRYEFSASTGLLTYESELVTGAGVSAVSLVKVSGFSSSRFGLGYRMNSATTEFLLPVEGSDLKKKNKIEFDHQITTIDYQYSGFIFGLAMGHHNVIVTKSDDLYIDSLAKGAGFHLGWKYSLDNSNQLVFDLLMTTPSSTKNSVPGSSTVVEMGARQEIFVGGTTPLFGDLFHLSLGLERASFKMKVDSKDFQETQTSTLLGIVMSLPADP